MEKNLWKNKKNGNIYEVISTNIINCTNEQDGQLMFLYKPTSKPVYDQDGNEVIFVRSENEFRIKFDKI